MKSNIAKITTLLATFSIPLSGMLVADSTSLQFGAGYRQDHITWDLKDKSLLNLNVRSDLNIKDIEIAFIGLKARTDLCCCPGYSRIEFDYGWVVDGKLRHQIEFERIEEFDQFRNSGLVVEGEYLELTFHNDVKDSSYVWDFDIAFAYPIQCGCDEFQIAPAIGFSYNRQQIDLHSDVTTHDASLSSSLLSCSEDSGFCIDNNREGRSSSYRVSWWGPWIGFDFAYNSCECWNLYGNLEFHFGRSRRQRNDHTGVEYFDRVGRTKNFWGPSFKIGSAYIICENWFLDGSFEWSKYFSDSDREDLTWSSASVRLDIGYMF